jgi:pimeloyl-ACP methyl ester carboxylesterase
MADGSTVVWKGGTEHWTRKGDVKLFLWSKKAAAGTKHAGTILFVHGSSMASQPTFDLTVPGRADSSAMDYFASLGYDTWTMDNEGYGRSDKNRPQNNDISNGATTSPWAVNTSSRRPARRSSSSTASPRAP